ncbi:retrovirus-related pol polyprotein from transposon TNT 1-94 [Tanacetum coccineum]
MAPSSSSTNSINVIQSSVFQNPLFLHPSNGPGSLCVQEKVVGVQNYRSWKRSIEIALSTKRKLGFIKGTVLRSLDDHVLKEQWDTCNNMFRISACALLQQEESQRGVFGNGKVGYPAWHYKSKQSPQKEKRKASSESARAPPKRTVAAVEYGSVMFTSK